MTSSCQTIYNTVPVHSRTHNIFRPYRLKVLHVFQTAQSHPRQIQLYSYRTGMMKVCVKYKLPFYLLPSCQSCCRFPIPQSGQVPLSAHREVRTELLCILPLLSLSSAFLLPKIQHRFRHNFFLYMYQAHYQVLSSLVFNPAFSRQSSIFSLSPSMSAATFCFNVNGRILKSLKYNRKQSSVLSLVKFSYINTIQ